MIFGITMTDIDFSNPTDEFVRSISLDDLLPQRPPFIMVDHLAHCEEKRVVSETVVQASNIYVENGVMQAYGLIENIAQTCAARIGYINKYILKKGIQIGFIGSLKNLEVESLPRIGEVITTEISIQDEVLGMILASANLMVNGKTLVKTELKIALKEE